MRVMRSHHHKTPNSPITFDQLLETLRVRCFDDLSERQDWMSGLFLDTIREIRQKWVFVRYESRNGNLAMVPVLVLAVLIDI